PGASPSYGLLLARHAAIQYGGDLEISTRSTADGEQVAEFVASLVFPRLPSTGESILSLEDVGSIEPAKTGYSVRGPFKRSESAEHPEQPSAYSQAAVVR